MRNSSVTTSKQTGVESCLTGMEQSMPSITPPPREFLSHRNKLKLEGINSVSWMSRLHQVSTIAKILTIEATAKEFRSLSLFTILRQFQRHTGIEQLSHWVDVAKSSNGGRV